MQETSCALLSFHPFRALLHTVITRHRALPNPSSSFSSSSPLPSLVLLSLTLPPSLLLVLLRASRRSLLLSPSERNVSNPQALRA
ncbi:hypothetical protein EYF80_060997 [Liparis tanakae]|uniref:Uncharacterized protein n=1 Tax=Liparis tanakae TaxID=230148 RepID=A0A4Z2EK87_9TELE|nr:hypothetical protein EYF80_060997 [Liparis tanakae]